MRPGGVNCPQGLDANSRGHASDQEDLVCEFASEAFVFDDLKSCGSGIAGAIEGGVGGGVARHVWLFDMEWAALRRMTGGFGCFFDLRVCIDNPLAVWRFERLCIELLGFSVLLPPLECIQAALKDTT